MFYILSKIIYPLISPISIILIFFMLYAFLRLKKHFYIGFFLLLFFTNPYLAQKIMGVWELDGINIKDNQKYDAIIILGGFATTIEIEGTKRPVFADGNDRMMQAIDLFKRGISKKIIYTGGTDSIFYMHEPEAFLGKKQLIICGIPDSCIWVEPKSLNTYENAIFTRNLLAQNDKNWADKKYILTTTAFHMRRALACFKKAGFTNITPYCTDFRSIRNSNNTLNTFIPTYGGLENWTYLWKEWLGMVVYKIRGYI